MYLCTVETFNDLYTFILMSKQRGVRRPIRTGDEVIPSLPLPRLFFFKETVEKDGKAMSKQRFEEDNILLFNDKPSKRRGRKKSVKFDWLSNLLLVGVDETVAKDWLKVRKDKKATNTQTAFEFTLRELEKIKSKFGVTYTDAITVCVIRNWMGCRCSFFDNINFAEYGIQCKNNHSQSINQNIPYYGRQQQRNAEAFVRTFTEEDQQNTVF